jgi:hypothetical protein
MAERDLQELAQVALEVATEAGELVLKGWRSAPSVERKGSYADLVTQWDLASEKLIRELLQDANPDAALPSATEVQDDTPEVGSTTRETFLGSSKDVNFAGPGKYSAGTAEYAYPSDQPADSFALEGDWRVETQYATPAGDSDAGIRLSFHADEVRMVLAGDGRLRVRIDGRDADAIDVAGTPRSYGLFTRSGTEGGGEQSIIEVEVPAGVEVYSFTFG